MEQLITEDVALYQEAIRQMDLYQQGQISWQEYQEKVPFDLLQRARDWQLEQTNREIDKAYFDLDLDLE